ncbi:MAG: hypothetical protein L0215_20185 [Gemmataceae bacterium]|nr:hypothetical protein [Gemmataceae bacterium]
MILLIGIGLGLSVFWLCLEFGWHWGVALFLGCLPIAASYFFGIFGVLGSAFFLGALYKVRL